MKEKTALTTGLNGGALGADNPTYRDTIGKGYAGAKSAEGWAELAQFVNYDGHRAMFEAQSKNRMGLLIAKKGSEPLHIQWNPATDSMTLNQGSRRVSSNFYMRGMQEGDFRAIRELPKVQL